MADGTNRGDIGNWKGLKLIAVIAFLSVGVFLWFFWFQSAMLLETRWAYRNIAVASAIPVPLGDLRVAKGEGSTLSSFGYEFQTPWQDVDTPNITRKNMTLIPFRSGLEILVGHGSTHSLVDAVMESSKIDPNYLRAAYGDRAAHSDYEFLKLALNATPGSIRILDSKKDVAQRSTLVLIKALVVPGDSGIFEVQSNEFRGFQYGDPSKHPKRVAVALYSPDGGIEFSFSTRDMKPLAISQADINRIIQTLRRTGLAETASK
jgi:hypothetical protein